MDEQGRARLSPRYDRRSRPDSPTPAHLAAGDVQPAVGDLWRRDAAHPAQLLAARHTPEPSIAGITSLALLAGTCAFLFGPLLDVWLSRRTYAIATTIFCAVGSLFVLLNVGRPAVLGPMVMVTSLMAGLNVMAAGGWLGERIAVRADAEAANASLGLWMQVANAVGFGIIAMIAIPIVRGLPALAPWLLAAPILLPVAVYAMTPGRPPDTGLAHETFGRFIRDIGKVVRRPVVWRLLLLFGAPSASFALTNTLGGLGRGYHASEGFVGFVGGAAATVAGLVGNFMVVPPVRRWPGRPLYLAVGAIGAVFTLSLIVRPRTPALFGVAMSGENIAQSAALTLANILALRSLGEDNPLAATQFGLLTCAANLPITYMQWLDGQAYGAGRLTALYLTDWGLGVVACAALALLLRAGTKGGARTAGA
jgi:PAT family beta-lactamase induction signal transducer AmpG